MKKISDGYFHIKDSKEYLPDFKSILNDSVFYPGCGADSMDLQVAKFDSSIYVHADYRVSKIEAELFLNNFNSIEEYELENIYEVDRSVLFPSDIQNNSFLTELLPLKKSEELLFQEHNKKILTISDTFLLGIYTLTEPFHGKNAKGLLQAKEVQLPSVLLVFFFCEDAMSIFNSLYFLNKVNPRTVALSNNMPTNPYWTNLVASDHRFRLALLINRLYNNCSMPQFVISDLPLFSDQDSVKRFEWKEYYLKYEYILSGNSKITSIYEKDMLII